MSDLIAKHGGYKNLKSFQMAEIVYDLTFEFVKRYISSFKQKEQMEGAARGGKQNIGEGSSNSGTSKETEIRLVSVARGSQEELKNDYEDFLRTRNLPIWPKDDLRAVEIRKLAYRSHKTYRTYMTYLSNPELAANCLLCLINQTCYLLDRQLESLDQDFQKHGDFKDRLRNIRKEQIAGLKSRDAEFFKQFGFRINQDGLIEEIPKDQ